MTQGTKKTVATLLEQDKDLLKELVRKCVQEALEAEMEAALGAAKSERIDARRGYRSGYYERRLITRVGTLDLRVPQDRDGRFSTEIFERYDRAEKALVTSLVEMHVQGVSTRKVKAITEKLCGHEFSASTVSRATKTLDDQLRSFAERPLEEAYPYLILDARYERVRESGVVCRRTVLIAIGINNDGRRCVLGVELANRESKTTWRDFLVRAPLSRMPPQ
jgi:transposase-like protein